MVRAAIHGKLYHGVGFRIVESYLDVAKLGYEAAPAFMRTAHHGDFIPHLDWAIVHWHGDAQEDG